MNADTNIWMNLAALSALAGTIIYAILGGADFGGGVWDLFARGPRKKEQRLAIQHAMGPVWEANHVWLIFVVVVLFTCFSRGYAILGIALFTPFHLALIGIILRGSAFVFRSYQSRQEDAVAQTSTWGIVFGAASLITPLFLGAAFGVVTEGALRVDDAGNVTLTRPAPWLTPYAISTGLLAVSTCAYLAAVYLTNETTGPLREDFRLRAVFSGSATAFLAALVLLFAWQEAGWFFHRLLSLRTLPVVLAGILCFAGSGWAVHTRRYALSRVFAAGEIALLIVGFGLAQYPFMIYPDVTFARAAAPMPTIRFVVLSLPFGLLFLVPALWMLFRVFKSGHAIKQH